MVSLSFCISSLKPIAVVVGFGWACFGVSGVFEVCAPACLLVWAGEERTAEAVSCSAVCTNLQAAFTRCWGVWCVVLSSSVWSCGRMSDAVTSRSF